jgi:hypothetical protein
VLLSGIFPEDQRWINAFIKLTGKDYLMNTFRKSTSSVITSVSEGIPDALAPSVLSDSTLILHENQSKLTGAKQEKPAKTGKRSTS